MAWTWDAIKKKAVRVKDEAVGASELVRALAYGAAAEPLAGLAGMYGAATGGVEEGVRYIDKVREKVGYQPESQEGRRNVEALARALSPVANALERGRTTLGDAAFNATGSPALGAAAYTAPDALLSLLGARPALSAGRSASEGIGSLARHVDARNMAPRQMHPQAGAINVPAYGMAHRPPMRDSGAPLHDVTGGGTVYPDDVYGPRGVDYYGTGDRRMDEASFRIIQSYRNNPDALVPVYRAVPEGVGDVDIAPGDWVTINKAYADMHGQGLDGGYRVVKKMVPARTLYTNGDSIHEWGFDPE